MLGAMHDAQQVALRDGRSLDVWVNGPPNGTVLLFHMGTPSSGLPSATLIEQAATAGLRLVTYSRAGYGNSTRRPGRSVVDIVEDMAIVLDAVGDADRLYVIGWSGGGPHALATAARLPDRVIAAATIASIAPYPASGLDYLAGMGAENVEEFNAALEGPEALIGFKEANWPVMSQVSGDDLADALGDLVDHVDRGVLTGEFTEWLAGNMREGLRPGYWGWFDDDMAFVTPWGFDLDEFRVPVHVWQGAHDRMVPFSHGEWLARHVSTAVPHLYPEHGHLSLATDLPAILEALVAGGSDV